MKYILILCLFMLSTSSVADDWIDKGSNDPRYVLNSAREDARRGDYENALKKHIWFHNNALGIDRSFYGVRLSFAMSDWESLAMVYPPALNALKDMRDRAERKVKAGDNYYNYFNDFLEINQRLNEEYRTIDLFKWLDEKHYDRAKRIYRIAQEALIRTNEFALCGKYIDPENSYLRYVKQFHSGLDYAEKSPVPERARNFSYMSFANDVSILVGLLSVSGRMDEAEEIAEMALLEWNNEEFGSLLSKSLEGHIPQPWP
ncbi:MAG: hypothetical protein ABW088_14180 [Sedimenticola sp.]